MKIQGIQSSQPQSSKAVYVPPNIRSGGLPPTPRTAVNHTPVERPIAPGLPIGYQSGSQARRKKRNAERAEMHKKKIEANKSSSDADVMQTMSPGQHQHQNQTKPAPNNNRNQRRLSAKLQSNNTANGANNFAPHQYHSNVQDTSPTNQDNANDGADNENHPEKSNRNRRRNRNNTAIGSTGDPEKDKARARVRVIQQKLRDIVKLKAKRDNGEGIDANQQSKINTEADLVKELNALKVSA